MSTPTKPGSPLHRDGRHESARQHVTGAARYVADLRGPSGTLIGWILPSPHAHARVLRRDGSAARSLPGVHAVLFNSDVPGDNTIGAVIHDEPLLAAKEVHFQGQAVALIVAESEAIARQAAALIEVDYQLLPAITDLADAVAAEDFLTSAHLIQRGDLDAAFADAHLVVEGELRSGAQDHFYLETQAALAIPEEANCWRILSSTQHPSEVQKMVAHVLGVGAHQVVCEVPRLGGGFGGKEAQATNYAALAALGAHRTGRPVRVWLHRDEDMRYTGNRHPFLSRYRMALDSDGRILGLDARLYSDGGWVSDLSGAIMDRALFHIDNAYYLPAVRVEGRACRTNLPSNTAFRGFGGPQGVLVIERALNEAAERLGVDPTELRVRNFYGDAPRDRTPYGQHVPAPRLQRILEHLADSSSYQERLAEIEAFNQGQRYRKRGLAMQPVKFGISFTHAPLNQAGALVVVYADGTVQLNHGGTEMGQGLYSKMMAVCAHSFGLPLSAVRNMATSTEKVPNTSPTAASSGTDLNGQAVRIACETVRDRMAVVAGELLGCSPQQVAFQDSRVHGPEGSLPFPELAGACWLRQVSLSSTGYYATPGIAYDHGSGQGTPFYYYAYGAAVVEVEVQGLTGEHRVRRVDVVQDVGDSLIPSIDKGQVEGGFVQGMGWLTCEELLYSDEGRLLTAGPSTYKIPANGDVPLEFKVVLLPSATQDGVIHGSKAVGEPPFLLAIGVLTALRRAIGAFGGRPVELGVPATPESILRAVDAQQA